MTPQEWAVALRQAAPRGKQWIIDGLADAMPVLEQRFEINTKDRQSHFLAQVIHESDGLQTTTEYASGSAYEGRRDLGNINKGDGVKYKGRGLIQLTGRSNYIAAATALNDEDMVRDPEIVAKFPLAATVSGWFWNAHKLNRHADAGDIKQITKIINGAYTHLDRRQAALDSVTKALA